MAKTKTKNTRKKAAKPERMPLTISIHGEGIDIDATLAADSDGVDIIESLARKMNPTPAVDAEALAAHEMKIFVDHLTMLPALELIKLRDVVNREIELREGQMPNEPEPANHASAD